MANKLVVLGEMFRLSFVRGMDMDSVEWCDRVNQ